MSRKKLRNMTLGYDLSLLYLRHHTSLGAWKAIVATKSKLRILFPYFIFDLTENNNVKGATENNLLGWEASRLSSRHFLAFAFIIHSARSPGDALEFVTGHSRWRTDSRRDQPGIEWHEGERGYSHIKYLTLSTNEREELIADRSWV